MISKSSFKDRRWDDLKVQFWSQYPGSTPGEHRACLLYESSLNPEMAWFYPKCLGSFYICIRMYPNSLHTFTWKKLWLDDIQYGYHMTFPHFLMFLRSFSEVSHIRHHPLPIPCRNCNKSPRRWSKRKLCEDISREGSRHRTRWVWTPRHEPSLSGKYGNIIQ